MRSAFAVAVLLALVACSRSASGQLPPGRYSGSTRDDAALTVDVRGDKVLVNNRKATFLEPDVNSVFRVRGVVFRCTLKAKGEEIACAVRFADHTEDVELMHE